MTTYKWLTYYEVIKVKKYFKTPLLCEKYYKSVISKLKRVELILVALTLLFKFGN